jgi:hypothetical protein
VSTCTRQSIPCILLKNNIRYSVLIIPQLYEFFPQHGSSNLCLLQHLEPATRVEAQEVFHHSLVVRHGSQYETVTRIEREQRVQHHGPDARVPVLNGNLKPNYLCGIFSAVAKGQEADIRTALVGKQPVIVRQNILEKLVDNVATDYHALAVAHVLLHVVTHSVVKYQHVSLHALRPAYDLVLSRRSRPVIKLSLPHRKVLLSVSYETRRSVLICG